jgi:hypothetical protein
MNDYRKRSREVDSFQTPSKKSRANRYWGSLELWVEKWARLERNHWGRPPCVEVVDLFLERWNADAEEKMKNAMDLRDQKGWRCVVFEFPFFSWKVFLSSLSLDSGTVRCPGLKIEDSW